MAIFSSFFFYNVEHVLGFLKQSFSIIINENAVDENCPEQRHVRLSFILFYFNSAALGFLSYRNIFMDILLGIC